MNSMQDFDSLYREFEKIALESLPEEDVKYNILEFAVKHPRDHVSRTYEIASEVLKGLCDIDTGIDVKRIARLSYAVVILSL